MRKVVGWCPCVRTCSYCSLLLSRNVLSWSTCWRAGETGKVSERVMGRVGKRVGPRELSGPGGLIDRKTRCVSPSHKAVPCVPWELRRGLLY